MAGWHRMGLDDAFQIRQVLQLALARTQFSSWSCGGWFFYSRYNECISIKPLSSLQLSFTRLCFMAGVPLLITHQLSNNNILSPRRGSPPWAVCN
jgi:hypothetical protein